MHVRLVVLCIINWWVFELAIGRFLHLQLVNLCICNWWSCECMVGEYLIPHLVSRWVGIGAFVSAWLVDIWHHLW